MRLRFTTLFTALLTIGLVIVLVTTETTSQTAHAQSSSNVELVGHIGGSTLAVFVQGDYAYIGEGARLTVLDISTPATPVVVGKSDMFPGIVRGIYVSSSYAYVTAGTDLRVVDVSNPATPTEVGSYYTTGADPAPTSFKYDIAVSGSYAYMAASFDGLRVVDVSNPAAPTEIGFFSTADYAYGVAISGSTAYVTGSYGGLRVIDISNPATPTEIGFYDTTGYAEDVAVSGSYAYVAAGYDGLRVIDISNPATPTEIGFYDTTGYAEDVAVSGSYAYMAASFDGLRVVDISNPAIPTEIGFYYIPKNNVEDIAVGGSTVYLADSAKGLQVVDVSNPAVPAEIGLYDIPDGSYRDVAVSGSNAYVADQYNGLRVIDISNPAAPAEIGFYDIPGDARDLAVSGNYAYVTDSSSYLRVVDISNPASPTEIGSYNIGGSANDVAVSGSTAYVADGRGSYGLRVIDVSNPAIPTEIGSYNIPGGSAFDVAVSGSIAYVAFDSGLRVVDVSNPATPTEIGFYNTPGGVYDIAVSGSTAYVATGYRGLWVVDVSNPATPTEIGFYNTSHGAYGVTVSGSTAYVAAGYRGLGVVDVSNPATPTEIGFYNTPGYAVRVAASGTIAYVTTGSGGLFILRYGLPTLDLHTENDTWPPVAGQKLVANINFANDSGGPMHLKHIGVRGRRNGSEFWDIGFWTVDLEDGQTWTFEANNERPLEPGDYSFRVSYSLDGVTWTEVGNEINFTVGSGGAASPLVDTATSTVVPSPTTVEADGVTGSTVIITLRNTAGAPLAGKTVQLVSERGAQDFIVQPIAPTNAQGQTTATVSSSVSGVSKLWVWVMDGGLKLNTPAVITFGATSPVPDEVRTRASHLVQRANSTLDTIWQDSQAVVSEAGYFRGAIGIDTFKLTFGVFSGLLDTWTGVSDWTQGEKAARFAYPGWKGFTNYILANLEGGAANAALCKISNAYIDDYTTAIGNNAGRQLAQLSLRAGLYYLTAQQDNTCLRDLKADLVVDSLNIGNLVLTHLEKPLAEWPIKKEIDDARTELQTYLNQVNLVQIRPLLSTEIEAYKKDLTARDLAFIVYEQRLKDARLTLESIHQVNSNASSDSLQTTLRLSAKGLAVYGFDGAGQALVGGTLGVFDTYMNTKALNESLLGATIANSTLVKTAPEAIGVIKDTTVQGLRQIAAGQPPCTPDGEISDIRHFSAGNYEWGLFWREQSSYTTLKLRNIGNCEATFHAVSRYLAQTTRLSVPWAELWMQDEAQLTLSPGQSGYVKIEYKTSKYGYSPREQQSLPVVGAVPASTINIDLVAINDDSGVFWVDHDNNTWLPTKEFASSLTVAGDIGVASTTPTIIEPLMVMAGGSLGQPYQSAYLGVNNPFTSTIAVTVTQPLPAEVTAILDAGSGQIPGNEVMWTGFVTPLATESFTFTFKTNASPGEKVTLPGATLELIRPNIPGEVLTTTTETTSFVTPRHLTFQRVTPDWVPPGSSSTAIVTATHYLTSSITGSFVLTITDVSGSPVWNSSQLLSITGAQSQTLTFALPTSLAIGDYQIIGVVSSHGTSEMVFNDPMSVGAYPPTLWVNASPVAGDGTVSPDSTLTYQVQVTNTAGIALSNVVITSNVPASVTVVADTISDNGNEIGNVISWTISSIPAGAGNIFTFDVAIPEDYVTEGGRYISCGAHLQSTESPKVSSPANIVLVYTTDSASREVYLPIVLKNM